MDDVDVDNLLPSFHTRGERVERDGPRPHAYSVGGRIMLAMHHRDGGLTDDLDAGEARELAAELLAAVDALEPAEPGVEGPR